MGRNLPNPVGEGGGKRYAFLCVYRPVRWIPQLTQANPRSPALPILRHFRADVRKERLAERRRAGLLRRPCRQRERNAALRAGNLKIFPIFRHPHLFSTMNIGTHNDGGARCAWMRLFVRRYDLAARCVGLIRRASRYARHGLRVGEETPTIWTSAQLTGPLFVPEKMLSAVRTEDLPCSLPNAVDGSLAIVTYAGALPAKFFNRANATFVPDLGKDVRQQHDQGSRDGSDILPASPPVLLGRLG